MLEGRVVWTCSCSKSRIDKVLRDWIWGWEEGKEAQGTVWMGVLFAVRGRGDWRRRLRTMIESIKAC